MDLGSIIRRNSLFLSLSLLFILGGLYFIVSYDQASIHLWSDARHSEWADRWMPYLTHLGDGFTFLALALVSIIFFNRRAFAMALFSALLTLILSSSLKAYFNEDRPLRYFEKQDITLNEVSGVKARYQHSFPSGHTTTAFAVWGLLAFFFRSKPSQALCFGLALTAGYSRIYLNMHFLRDVGAGAALGSFIMLLSVFLAGKLRSPWFDKTWFKWGNEILR